MVAKTEGAVAEAIAKVTKHETSKTMEDGTVKYKCQYCGKWIGKDENIDAESGDHCRHLREQGMDDEFLMDYRKERTVATPPEGWVKVAIVDRMCKKAGIPISALVKAFGGDRGLGEPTREEFRFVYCGRARWVDGWCATPDGLKYLNSLSRNGGISSEITDGDVPKAKARKSVKAPTNELEAALAEAL